MASGWAKDGAVQDQIDASIADAVKLARSQMAAGAGLTECEDCGDEIPAALSAKNFGTRSNASMVRSTVAGVKTVNCDNGRGGAKCRRSRS
jgi:NCAIR mutase (PurE)-related protein